MITNEEAKCIAEGIAEQALNAIEKKLKGMGEDFSEVKELAGLGKPTPYKVPLNVRITQEAADIMARHPNKSEVVDQLIKEYLK